MRARSGRHVERQASRVKVAFVERIGIALANPRLGVRIRGRTRADADALAAWAAHVGHRSSSSVSAAISRAAALSGAVSRASRPAATLSAKTMRWWISERSAGSGCSASDCRASLPMMVVLTRRLMTKAARSAGRNTCASRISETISALAHVVGAGLYRDQHALGRQQRGARQGGDARRAVDDDVIGATRQLRRFLMQRFAGEAHGAEQPGQALLASALRPVERGTLRVSIQQDDVQAAHRQLAGDVGGERGLADAAFLVENATIMARPSLRESRLGCAVLRLSTETARFY